MTITLPNGFTLKANGRQFMLRPGGVHFSGFNDVAFNLVKRQIITADQQQTGEDAKRFIVNAADAMMQTWLLSHANAMEKKAFVVFGGNRFMAVANPHGDWTLLNPAKDVLRLTDTWKGHWGVVVGYPASLRHAFELAVLRTFHAQDLTIPYAKVNQHVMALAETLLLDAEAKRVEPGGEIKMLEWTEPPPLALPPIE